MTCPRMGLPPISTIGFGRADVSSPSREPRPPARMTAFMRPHPNPQPPPATADVVVVGAGILGLAVARERGRRDPRRRIVVLEREGEIGAHQTGHNSGVVHAGIYYTPGSRKARLCVEGARDLYVFMEERGIAHERCGNLIIATHPG